MERAFDHIRQSANRPVVVSHGTAIRIGATVLLELPMTASRHSPSAMRRSNIFVASRERMILELWNDTSPHARSDEAEG